MGAIALTSGLVADCLNFQDWTTLTAIRKLFTSSGQFVWIVIGNITKILTITTMILDNDNTDDN